MIFFTSHTTCQNLNYACQLMCFFEQIFACQMSKVKTLQFFCQKCTLTTNSLAQRIQLLNNVAHYYIQIIFVLYLINTKHTYLSIISSFHISLCYMRMIRVLFGCLECVTQNARLINITCSDQFRFKWCKLGTWYSWRTYIHRRLLCRNWLDENTPI